MSHLTEESESYRKLAKPSNYKATPLAELREAADSGAESFRSHLVFAGERKDIVIQRNELAVPATILTPAEQAGNVMVYFHGGGWTWGSRRSHMSLCEMLAHCVVVSVEYRLAPEHKVPACYEDALAAVEWCLEHSKDLTGCEGALVGVAGDSAGGNIAAITSQRIPSLDYQVLIYPSLTLLNCERFESHRKYGKDHLLTAELMDWFTDQFLSGDNFDQDAVMGSPLLQPLSTRLPTALFLIAECDPLADQSPEYIEKLKVLGTTTQIHTLGGTVHGFVNKPGHFRETMKETIEVIRRFLASLQK